MRIITMTLISLALAMSATSSAAPMTFKIDSDLSRLEFTATFRSQSGDIIPLTEQLPGSLSVPMGGTFTADVTESTINLSLETTAVTPADRFLIPSIHQPTIGDIGSILSVPQFNYLVHTAIRDMTLTIGVGSRSLLGDGTFDVGSSLILFIRNHVGLAVYNSGSFYIVTGNRWWATNAPSLTASLVRDNDEVTLTLPIQFQYSFDTGSRDVVPFESQMHGVIVAKATIPEAPSLSLISLLGITIFVWRYCRTSNLSRANFFSKIQ